MVLNFRNLISRFWLLMVLGGLLLLAMMMMETGHNLAGMPHLCWTWVQLTNWGSAGKNASRLLLEDQKEKDSA